MQIGTLLGCDTFLKRQVSIANRDYMIFVRSVIKRHCECNEVERSLCDCFATLRERFQRTLAMTSIYPNMILVVMGNRLLRNTLNCYIISFQSLIGILVNCNDRLGAID